MFADRFRRLPAAFLILSSAAACASGPRARLEGQLVKAGVDVATAECLAFELNERLDREEVNSISTFLDGLDRSQSPGDALDALLSIDDPRAAAGVARAGVTCALGRLGR